MSCAVSVGKEPDEVSLVTSSGEPVLYYGRGLGQGVGRQACGTKWEYPKEGSPCAPRCSLLSQLIELQGKAELKDHLRKLGQRPYVVSLPGKDLGPL